MTTPEPEDKAAALAELILQANIAQMTMRSAARILTLPEGRPTPTSLATADLLTGQADALAEATDAALWIEIDPPAKA